MSQIKPHNGLHGHNDFANDFLLGNLLEVGAGASRLLDDVRDPDGAGNLVGNVDIHHHATGALANGRDVTGPDADTARTEGTKQ